MTRLKAPGASCPQCSGKPAEYRMAGDPCMRWRCSCGAEGHISASAPAPAPAARRVLPHWTTKKG